MPRMPYPAAGPPNAFDFPPLLRNGTNAEPMQVERAKMRPSQGNVWNGAAARVIQHPTRPFPGQPPVASPTQTAPSGSDHDPDFPRRVPSNRPPGVLYDPSGNKAGPPRPDSTVSANQPASSTVHSENQEMSVEDAIEAKLAALSVASGIAIGPPPNKAPSYAKIVRRD